MRISLHLLALFYLTLAPLHAQRSIRIVHLGAPAQSPLKEIFIYGTSAQTLATPIQSTLNRSNFCPQIPIDQDVGTLKILPQAHAPGTPFPKNSLNITINPNWKDTLLLFFHDPKSAHTIPVKIHQINASPDAFKPGALYWFNLSDYAIGGIAGTEKINIGPGQNHLMSCPSDEIECVIKLDYLRKGEERSRTLIRQMWRVGKSTRQVVLILKQPAPKHATYYVLPVQEPLK